jgi:hypothetical protein
MAKKTTSRSNAEPKPDAAEASAPAAKPRSRARASKPQQIQEPVAVADDRATTVGDQIETPTTLSATGYGNGAAADDGTASLSMASEPSEDDIRMRAYHRYLERGGGHGMDFEDWLAAERELRRRR